MVIGCCINCKYLDLIDDKTECTCLRCSGKMISLDISSDEWNKFNNEEMKARIDAVISSQLKEEKNDDEVIEDKTGSFVNEEQIVATNSYDNLMDDVDEIPDYSDFTTSGDNIEESEDQCSVIQSEDDVSPTQVLEHQGNNAPANTSIPTVKKKNAPKDVTQRSVDAQSQSSSVPAVRKKNTSVNSKYVHGSCQIPTQSSVEKMFHSVTTGSSPLAYIIVSIVVAVILVVVAMITSSSIGGVAAIISAVVSMSTIFMNGYDIFENTHTAIRYVVWGTFILISILGIIL